MTYEVIEDLVSNNLDHLEGCGRSYGIDKDVTMDTDEVLGIQNGVLIL